MQNMLENIFSFNRLNLFQTMVFQTLFVVMAYSVAGGFIICHIIMMYLLLVERGVTDLRSV